MTDHAAAGTSEIALMRVFVVNLIAWILSTTPCPAAENQTEIYKKAKAHHDRIDNFKVRYTLSFRKLAEPPAYSAEKVEFHTEPYRLEFAKLAEKRKLAKMKLTSEGQDGDGDIVESSSVFDGKATLQYVGSDILEIFPEKKPVVENGDYFCSEVLSIPLTDMQRATADNSWYYPSCLRDPLNARAKYRVTEATHKGHTCLLLEAPGYDKIWVDPKVGYSPRLRERYFGPDTNALIVRDESDDYREVAPGLWIPFRWTREYFPTLNNPKEMWNKPHLEMTLVVEQLTVNQLTDADFAVTLPAGGFVRDHRVGKIYRLPGKSSDVVAELLKSGDSYQFGESKPPQSPQWRRWLIGINIVVFVTLVTFFFWRRTRRSIGAGNQG